MNILIMANLHHNIVGGAETYNKLLYKLFQEINFIEISFLPSEKTDSQYKNVVFDHSIDQLLFNDKNEIFPKKSNLILKFNLLSRVIKYMRKRRISIKISRVLEKIIFDNNIEKIIWATSYFFNKKFIKKYNSKIYFIQHQHPLHYFKMYSFDYDNTKKFTKYNILTFFKNLNFSWNYNYFKYINNIIAFDENNKKVIEKEYKNKQIYTINIPSKFSVNKSRSTYKNLKYDFIIPIRIERQKNPLEIANFAKWNCCNKFLICGSGSLTNLVQDIKNIIISKPLNDINLINAYNESKFLLLFSYFEGFPIVIAEAFSFGIPCIIPDTFPSAKYLIGENNERGLVFDINDQEKFEKINLFKNTCDYAKISSNIEKFSKDNLSEEKFALSWSKIFYGKAHNEH